MPLCQNCAVASTMGAEDYRLYAKPCMGGDCGSDPARRWSQSRNIVAFTLKGGRQPSRPYPGDAGWDLYTSETSIIPAGGFMDLHTGLYISLPPGHWGHLLPRSSTLREYGLHIVPAVIDNGYRGEVFVAAHNPNMRPIMIECGCRLAQLIPHRIAEVEWIEVKHLPNSSRGTGGFGSSGK